MTVQPPQASTRRCRTQPPPRVPCPLVFGELGWNCCRWGATARRPAARRGWSATPPSPPQAASTARPTRTCPPLPLRYRPGRSSRSSTLASTPEALERRVDLAGVERPEVAGSFLKLLAKPEPVLWAFAQQSEQCVPLAHRSTLNRRLSSVGAARVFLVHPRAISSAGTRLALIAWGDVAPDGSDSLTMIDVGEGPGRTSPLRLAAVEPGRTRYFHGHRPLVRCCHREGARTGLTETTGPLAAGAPPPCRLAKCRATTPMKPRTTTGPARSRRAISGRDRLLRPHDQPRLPPKERSSGILTSCTLAVSAASAVAHPLGSQHRQSWMLLPPA